MGDVGKLCISGHVHLSRRGRGSHRHHPASRHFLHPWRERWRRLIVNQRANRLLRLVQWIAKRNWPTSDQRQAHINQIFVQHIVNQAPTLQQQVGNLCTQVFHQQPIRHAPTWSGREIGHQQLVLAGIKLNCGGSLFGGIATRTQRPRHFISGGIEQLYPAHFG